MPATTRESLRTAHADLDAMLRRLPPPTGLPEPERHPTDWPTLLRSGPMLRVVRIDPDGRRLPGPDLSVQATQVRWDFATHMIPHPPPLPHPAPVTYGEKLRHQAHRLAEELSGLSPSHGLTPVMRALCVPVLGEHRNPGRSDELPGTALQLVFWTRSDDVLLKDSGDVKVMVQRANGFGVILRPNPYAVLSLPLRMLRGWTLESIRVDRHVHRHVVALHTLGRSIRAHVERRGDTWWLAVPAPARADLRRAERLTRLRHRTGVRARLRGERLVGGRRWHAVRANKALPYQRVSPWCMHPVFERGRFAGLAPFTAEPHLVRIGTAREAVVRAGAGQRAAYRARQRRRRPGR